MMGIYGWSKHMFAHLGGFIAAYCHGAGDAIDNASYLTAIFSAFGALTLFRFFGKETTWPVVLLWVVVFLVLKGVKTSKWVNNIATIAKVIPIVLFITLAIIHFDLHIFMSHCHSTMVYNVTTKQWSHVLIFDQSKSFLLAAMWTLIGIESGTIFAIRAKKLSDVAKATTIGQLLLSYF